MELTTTQLVAGAAALGLIGTCWNQIREVFRALYGFVIVSVEADDYTLFHAVCMVLWDEFKIVSFRSYSYDGFFVYRPSLRKRQFTAFEQLSKHMVIFRKGWRFLIVSWTPEKEEGPKSVGHGISFSFIRGMFNADELIEHAVTRYNERFGCLTSFNGGDRFQVSYCYGDLGKRSNKNHDEVDQTPPAYNDDFERYYSMRPVGAERTDIGYRRSALWKEIYILDDLLKKATEEARFWLAHRDWYMERGIPWKRGWLLTGEPGCVLASTKIQVRKKSNEGKHKIVKVSRQNQDGQ